MQHPQLVSKWIFILEEESRKLVLFHLKSDSASHIIIQYSILAGRVAARIVYLPALATLLQSAKFELLCAVFLIILNSHADRSVLPPVLRALESNCKAPKASSQINSSKCCLHRIARVSGILQAVIYGPQKSHIKGSRMKRALLANFRRSLAHQFPEALLRRSSAIRLFASVARDLSVTPLAP